MKHIFVINPIAGVKNSAPIVLEEIKELCSSIEYVIYETKARGDAIDFVKEYIANHEGERLRFYACGGDGTLNEVIQGSAGNDNVEIACVPIGSGNDFIKYFGKAEDFLNIKDLIEGEVVECDLLKLNDLYVVNVFNIGIDANVVVMQAKLKKLPLMTGVGAYKFGVALSILGRITNRFKITVDDEVIYDGKTTLCAVGNARCYGGGYYCAPLAMVNDGLLDVCMVKKVSRITFASLVKVYKAGKHLEDPRVKKYIVYKQGKKVHIEIDRVLPYSIDGELGYGNDLFIQVINKALRFVIPKKRDK